MSQTCASRLEAFRGRHTAPQHDPTPTRRLEPALGDTPGQKLARTGGLARRSHPLRVPIVGADPPLQRLHLVAEHVLAQEGDLVVEGVLGEIDPPRAGTAVLAPAPTVAAAVERNLVLERCTLRPEAEARPPGPLQEVGEGGVVGGGEGTAEQVQGGVAVVQGPVPVVEDAALGGEVGQL